MQIITGTVRSYAWGSRTAIPQFLGLPGDGSPQAEVWWGAHPAAPSQLGRQTLTDLIAADPDALVGVDAVEAFGPRLPYLLKVLAAEQPLSLQAHPSRTQAEAGYAREEAAGISRDDPERVYADDWPKPEMMVALGKVDALCGFREPAETYALFAQLGVEEATRLVAPLQSEGSDGLRAVFAELLRLGEPDHALVAQVVAAAAELTAADATLAAFARTATELDGFFPGDPGVLAALLLNRLQLVPGEALFLPAGNLHAYLRGFGVEIMANSDNTVRGGLTSKHIAVEELLDLLEFAPGQPPLVELATDAPGVQRYLTPAPEFTLWRLDPPEDDCAVPGKGCGRIVLVTDGEISLESRDEILTLERGQAAFARPGEELRAAGAGVAFVAAPGGLYCGV